MFITTFCTNYLVIANWNNDTRGYEFEVCSIGFVHQEIIQLKNLPGRERDLEE